MRLTWLFTAYEVLHDVGHLIFGAGQIVEQNVFLVIVDRLLAIRESHVDGGISIGCFRDHRHGRVVLLQRRLVVVFHGRWRLQNLLFILVLDGRGRLNVDFGRVKRLVQVHFRRRLQRLVGRFGFAFHNQIRNSLAHVDFDLGGLLILFKFLEAVVNGFVHVFGGLEVGGGIRLTRLRRLQHEVVGGLVRLVDEVDDAVAVNRRLVFLLLLWDGRGGGRGGRDDLSDGLSLGRNRLHLAGLHDEAGLIGRRRLLGSDDH